MTTLVRNIAVCTVMLAAMAVARPARVAANTCEEPWIYIDYQYWSGSSYCAPGGQDACGYFRSECDYYCFTQYQGNLCWNEFYLCEQYNAGTEWDPEYCLEQAFCNCHYSW